MTGTPNTMALERGSRLPQHPHKSASLRSWIAGLIDKSRPDIDPKEGFVKSVWSKVEDDYHKMADELVTACKDELRNRSIPAVVESRVKSRGSIAKSLDRLEVYRQARKEEPYRNVHDILKDLHDLVGIRIIVDYVDHIEATTTFVTTTFRKEKEPNVFSANRKVGHSWTAWFGAYECTNHHVSAEYGEQNSLSYYNGVIFEIQVTSLPASLYNKIAHPLLYKEEAGDLSQGDEIIIDLTKGLAFCYSLCTYYKRHKLDAKPVDTQELELMQKASSAFEGPQFISSIGELAGRIPGVDTAEIKGKSIPRERLEILLKSLLSKGTQSDIGQSIADQLRQEIKDIGRPRIELHAFGRARFDSQDVYQSPICQEGTQTGAISYIHKWIEEGKKPLLWIYSHAGTGKSTLARTIARNLVKTGQIAAGYFFKRGDVGRNHLRHVIPTLAAQLISTIPQYECYLRESFDACKNTDFENMLLHEQFKVLLKTPLSQVETLLCKVIIIDALDECVDLVEEDNVSVDQLIYLLSSLNNVSVIKFSVLVTSRDESILRSAMEHQGHEALPLATTFRRDNISDIESILRLGFLQISKERNYEQAWPKEADFITVLQRSTDPFPLFIYARTLLLFLGLGTKKGYAKKRLATWLKSGLDLGVNTRLDEMYTTVFENLDPDAEPGRSGTLMSYEKEDIRKILGAIALAVEPLSVNSLVAILNLDEEVRVQLESCRAVLDVPTEKDKPVHMLHKSFSDFLLKRDRKNPYWFSVDEREQHESFAAGCLNHLEQGLTKNICHLHDPAILRAKIDPAIIKKYIPDSLQYASSHWVEHLQKVGDTNFLNSSVELFLSKQFLEWIECLAILGRLDKALLAIEELRAVNQSDSKVGRFLYDGYRFLLKHGPIIQNAPRQTYGSALLFSPTNSIIRTAFWDSRLPGCHNLRNMPEEWDSVLQRKRLVTGVVRTYAFALSADGSLLATSHTDDITSPPKSYIELWHARTGAHLSRAGVPSRAKAISWTRGEESLISVTDNGQVYIHNFRQDHPLLIGSQPSETLFNVFEGELSSLGIFFDNKVAISATGVLAIAHPSDEKDVRRSTPRCDVTVWNSFEDRIIHAWALMAEVSSLAISQDSRQVAVAAGARVRLLDTTTKSMSDLIETSQHTLLAFSADGTQLLILSKDSHLTIFSIQEGSYSTMDAPNMFSCKAMALHPDKTTIAFITHNGELLLSDIRPKDRQEHATRFNEEVDVLSTLPLEGSVPIEEFSYAEMVNMSPNGQYLASLYKTFLFLWRVQEGTLNRVLVPQTPSDDPPAWGLRNVLNFSRDGSSILAASNCAVYVWTLGESDSSQIKISPTTTIPFADAGRHLEVTWMNGKRIAINSWNRVEIWDIEDNGHCLGVFEKSRNDIGSLAFAPEPGLLAYVSGSTVNILSESGADISDKMTTPLTGTGLSFSPDASILFIDGPGRSVVRADVVNDLTHSGLYGQDSISPPVIYPPLEEKDIPVDSQFPYCTDPHSSDLIVAISAFSTDGMFIKQDWPRQEWYKIQHARHIPVPSQSLCMVWKTYTPEKQIWVQRDGQRVIQIPRDCAYSCVGYGGKHVAMIDHRQKILLLELN